MGSRGDCFLCITHSLSLFTAPLPFISAPIWVLSVLHFLKGVFSSYSQGIQDGWLVCPFKVRNLGHPLTNCTVLYLTLCSQTHSILIVVYTSSPVVLNRMRLEGGNTRGVPPTKMTPMSTCRDEKLPGDTPDTVSLPPSIVMVPSRPFLYNNT